MTIYLLIALGLLLLLLVLGTASNVTNGGSGSMAWINALRNVIIAILAALVVIAALPIVEAALA